MKHRKSNRAKRRAKGCRNNGSCKWCTDDRTHANRRAEPIESGTEAPLLPCEESK